MKEKILTIIHADDDADDCMFFKDALEALTLSTQLTTVHDGEKLMHLLENTTSELLPHILFLDLNMPRKNGLECLIEIKQNAKLKQIPVVILSTTNVKETINTVFKNGAHVYIHKPGEFAQLKQVIRHALPIATEKEFSHKPLKYILNA